MIGHHLRIHRGMEPQPGWARPSRVRLQRISCCALFAACLGGCAQAGTIAAHDSAGPTPEPTALVCPSGEYTSTDPGYGAPKPFATRQNAIESWLRLRPDVSREYVIDSDGRSAWFLRTDGTAEAHVLLLEQNGFLVDGFDVCS